MKRPLSSLPPPTVTPIKRRKTMDQSLFTPHINRSEPKKEVTKLEEFVTDYLYNEHMKCHTSGSVYLYYNYSYYQHFHYYYHINVLLHKKKYIFHFFIDCFIKYNIKNII